MLIRLAKMMGMKGLVERDPAEVRTVFFLLFMYTFLIADTMLLFPSVKPIMDEFGRNEADVGLISSIFIFLGAGVAIPWGYLADRYPRKTLVAFTVLIGEIPCLLTGYVKSYDQLLWVRSLTGLGIGGILPLIYSMVGDLVSEKERSTASAWTGLAEGVGTAAGMFLAGNLANTSVRLLGATGWRLPFVIVALPNFLLVPIFWLTCREPTRGAGEQSIKEKIERGREYQRRIRPSDYINIFKNRTNLHAFLQGIPGTIGWGVLPAWVITYYNVEKGVSISMATNLMLLVGIGMIFGGLFGGFWGDRLHRRSKKYLPMFCGITTLVGIAFFYIMFHYPVPRPAGAAQMIIPLIIGILAGVFITMTSSNIRAIVLNVNPPENRGAMMSLFSVTDSIGRGVGPYLGGVMIGVFGYVLTMDIATFFWIPCALVFLLLMMPRYPKDAARLEKLMEERAAEMEKN